MENDIKGIIFDLDGTLFDSCSMWHQIDSEFFKKRNMQIPDGFGAKIAPLGTRHAANYVRTTYNFTESEDEIIEEWHNMAVDKYTNEVELKPYVKEFLDACKKKGVKLTIATANEEKFYLPCLKRNGIFEYFDYICDVNQLNGRTKNDPTIYLHIARIFGLNPNEMVVFEDIPQALRSAKSAGFYTIAVDDTTEKDTEEEKKEIADKYIYSFEELLNL